MGTARTQPLNDCIVNMVVLEAWVMSQGAYCIRYFVG
jgi:hypothetical protein